MQYDSRLWELLGEAAWSANNVVVEERGGKAMLVTDILNSCGYRYVAEAAVASIGGEFAEKVRSSATARGQSVGEFTAQNVRLFSDRASERDWRMLASRMKGEDLALLTGLKVVMTQMMVYDGGSTQTQSSALAA